MPLGNNGLEITNNAKQLPGSAHAGNVLEYFERQAQFRPNAPAVICGEAELTYQALDVLCNQIAHYLRRLHVGPEKRVAICMEGSPRMLVAMLGVLKAGGIFVPLDPAYPAERLSYMIRDSAPQVLLVDRELPSRLTLQNAIQINLSVEKEKIEKESSEKLESRLSARNAAYIIYTSGSTGLPKGVVVEHGGLINLVQAQEESFGVRPSDRILQFASFSFDASVFEILMALCSGATMIMAERELLMPGPAMVALLESQCVTQITVPPSVLRHLPDATLPKLRQIIVAGEAFDAQLLNRWGQGRQFFNAYGPTEATIWAGISACAPGDEDISIGGPIANTRLYILDQFSETATGEICIGGQGVARGYWGRPDLTAERFVPDPFSGEMGSRIYRTGDLGCRRPDGTIMFLGRKDDQVKIRGHRVELSEIEMALSRHSKVLAAVVLARDLSTGDKLLVGYVLTHKEQQVDSAELRHHLAAHLPAYMVPAQFVMMNTFPLTANGKIDRKALGAHVAPTELPSPEPRTTAEKALVDACAAAGLFHVSLTSTFMEMGGSSLNASQVAASIRGILSVELPLKDLLSTKPLQEIAHDLAEILPAASPTHLRIKAKRGAQKLPPASFSQERVWFLNQMDESSLAYNANAKLVFSGKLDVDALTRVLRRIVERHEIYRTTFTEIEGRLFQNIHQPWQVDLGMVDLVGMSPSDQARHAEEVFNQQARRTFDLKELPLVRWRLVRFQDEKHALFITEHHVIHDGWSFNIFLKELTQLYMAEVANAIPRISESPLQFADFAQWQREFAESDTAQLQLEYWKKTLEGVSPLLSLPYDHPRPVVQTYKGSVEIIEVSEALLQQLSVAARKEHVTQYMLFAAAFQVLLFRYSGQQDFCIGTAIANRKWAETNDLIGMLVDNVALRARIDPGATIGEQIQQAKKTTLEAYEHQDIPFDKVVQAVSPQRDLSYNPIFQVMLSFHDSRLECASLGSLTLGVEPALSNGSAKFDLNVVMVPAQNNGPNSHTRLLWEYNTDLFERETVRRLAKHYLRLLEATARFSELKLAEIQLLDDAEYSQIVDDWNRTEVEVPRQCLHRLFEQQAARTPDAVAVRFAEREIDYRQLNERANQVARYLRKAGVMPETLVGICMERSLDLIVSLLGILKAGAAYVPLDPALPAGRIGYMLEDSRSSMVLTERALLGGLPQCPGQTLCLEEHWDQIAREATGNLETLSHGENLAYVIYTSGSTGTPKGVMVPHQGLVNVLDHFRAALPVTERDAILATTTLSFDIAALELYLPLLAGGKLVVAGSLQSEMQELAAKVEQEGISVLQGTPTLWNFLATQSWGSRGKDLKILCGGEALEKTTAERLLGISKTVWNVYGPTETTVWSSAYPVRSAGEHVVAIGQPIGNTRMYVLDDNMQPVPVGVAGDLFIGGMGLARGYVNRADLTGERFVPDPFAVREAGRLYATGDVARWKADGNLEYAGRKDYQVKVRGYRIELGEIEAALLENEEIEQAVVVASDDGQGGKMLVAYVVTAGAKKASSRQWHEALKSRLPEYMVPSHFMVLDKLPQTANGKIDRKALPGLDRGQVAAGQPYVAPEKPIAKALAQIWESVLQVERVGIHDNFFQLGGHSLLGIQVIARVRKAYHVDLPLRSIFAMPTIARFSDAVEEAVFLLANVPDSTSRNAPAIEPHKAMPDEPIPLSSAQQAFWFLDRLVPGNPAYNVAPAFRLQGAYDLSALEKAITFLVGRHDSLRTVFTTRHGLPIQVVKPHLNTPLRINDLRGLPEEGREKGARAEVTAEAQYRFDLESGPLFRASVVLLGEQELLLLFCMHHIISDRWSIRLLLREFRIAYAAFAAGDAPELPPLPLQFSDYAFWQQDFFASDTYRRQLEYWKTKLANAPGILELPLDSPRPPVQTHRGGKRSFRLPMALADRLNAIAQQSDASLFMLFVAAFKVLLYRYSGEEDVCIGFPAAARSHAALETVIGLFLNTLLLRTNLSGDPAFSALLHQVRENTLGAYDNQDVPFERLVEELQPERDSSHFPLFQVMVVFHNKWLEEMTFPGIQLQMLELSTQATMFDLTLSLTEEAGTGVSGFFRYNADLFTDLTIQRMIGDFTALLEGIAKNPELPISLLPMLAEKDLKAMAAQELVGVNLPFNEFPAEALESSIAERFRRQAARCPENVAVVSGNTAWTYRELDALSNSIAVEILRHSASVGGRIGLLLEHTGMAVAAMVGVLKAGCVYVPMEPSYPVERLRHILQDAQAFLVLTSRHLSARAREAAGSECEVVEVEMIAAAEAPAVMLPVSPRAIACLLYTSGSTGRPKGALQSHQHILHVVRNYTNRLHISESDRLLLLASFVHVASLPDIYAALLNGAAVCLYDIKNQGVTGLPDWLREMGVTIYHSVSTVYRLLLGSAPQPAALQGVRAVVLGGEEVFVRDVEAYQRTFSEHCVFVNMYGSTESTVTTMGMLNKASRIERDPVPVGMPVGANEVLLLGSSGKPTKIVGEIAVRNPYLPGDHWNRHGSESPFYVDASGQSVYRTGDYGRLLTDGNMVLLGRKDFQVKIRGFRVELGEIEAVMSRCAGVGQAIVVAQKDPLGNKRLAAYVVPSNKNELPDLKDLRNQLRQLLPAYMVPELIVPAEKVAYTATGKIDRNSLPALDWGETGTGREYVEPRNDLEQKMCEIWREILNLDRISIHDNFFDLGGHSLLAIQILERIRKECRVSLPIHELFGAPTIAAVVAAIEEKQHHASELPAEVPLVPISRRRHASVAKEGN